MLTFNEEKHLYYWEDRPVPSVTQIIREWMEINVYGNKYFTNRFTGTTIATDVFRVAADFGTAVHAGAKVLAEGRALDFNALDSALVAPLREFTQWMKDHKPEMLIVEKPLYSAKYGYAGTPDLICVINRKIYVVDIKTGMFEMAGIQLSAYEQLYREHAKRGALHMSRYVLHLPKDGSAYKFIKKDNQYDFPCFQNMLSVDNFIRRIY